MEIKVGQKWEHKFDKREAVTILNILEGKNKYIEYKYNDDDTVCILSDHIFSLNFTPIPQFRPHWLSDDGIEMYADDVDIDENNCYHFVGNFVKYSPLQHINKESDFGMLFRDGSHMWARWIGEDND